MDNFDPYNVLLSIATNIAVLLMTVFVLQRQILSMLQEIVVIKVKIFDFNIAYSAYG